MADSSTGCRGGRARPGTRYIWRHRNFPPGAPSRGSYVPNFFEFQPALNFGYAQPRQPWQNPIDAPGPRANRAALRAIIEFWMARGASGFRVDMARHLVKEDAEYRKTRDLWRELAAWFHALWPEGVLISEWGQPDHALDAGFDIDFVLPFRQPVYGSLFFNQPGPGWTGDEPCYFDPRGLGSAEAFLDWYEGQRHAVAGRGHISVPSSNHDFQRPACGDRGARELRLIHAFLLTLPGVPFLYYGDEIGMRSLPGAPSKEGSLLRGYERAGARTPMHWDRTTNAGFSTAPADALYLPLDPDPRRPDVASQDGDPASLLELVRWLVALRAGHPALWADGGFTPHVRGRDGGPLIYSREATGERLLVALNPAARPARIELDLTPGPPPELLIAEGARMAREQPECGTLELEPSSFGIFRT